MVISAFSS